ncbi:MAG: hypothetical protein JW883_13365 [Deltaproteobacteria bacterium]|nr:hypothetical protein [Deltaproteobacteria bacterium]
MTRQISFSKLEQDLRARLREKVSAAESTEDVKKFFAQTVGELLQKVLGDNVDLRYEDIRFNPREKGAYVISERLQKMKGFASVWRESDLPHIIKRMAEFALKRHEHLERHRDKTEAKMYPVPGKATQRSSGHGVESRDRRQR